MVYDNSLHSEDGQSIPQNVLDLKEKLETQDDMHVQLTTYAEEDLSLFSSDELVCDHLVLFPSKKETVTSKGTFNQHELLNFVNNNGNLLVIDEADNHVPKAVKLLLNEAGIYPAPKGYRYYDFHNTVEGKPVIGPKNIEADSLIGVLANPFIYDGTSALISNSELLFPILVGSETSFTASEKTEMAKEKEIWSYGRQSFLAVGFQALNKARMTWIGSYSLLTDELIKWTFQKKAVLKLQYTEHFNLDKPEILNPKIYRIKDQIVYTVGLSELKDGKWIPYVKQDDDEVQLSFEMLDPYYRLNLVGLGEASSKPDGELDTYIYLVNFTIPDQHGIFTLNLDYKRPLLSYVEKKETVTVRHLANDEYKRSWDITNSWLYVASALLVMISWFMFVINFLYIGNTDHQKKNI